MFFIIQPKSGCVNMKITWDVWTLHNRESLIPCFGQVIHSPKNQPGKWFPKSTKKAFLSTGNRIQSTYFAFSSTINGSGRHFINIFIHRFTQFIHSFGMVIHNIHKYFHIFRHEAAAFIHRRFHRNMARYPQFLPRFAPHLHKKMRDRHSLFTWTPSFAHRLSTEIQ